MTYMISETPNQTRQNDIGVNTLANQTIVHTLTDQPENLSSRKLWSLLTEYALTQQDAQRIKQELVKRKHLSLFDRRSTPH